jgi:NADH-quinone oxidoreductase subunit L
VSVPKAWGGGERFHNYLQPVFASSEALLSSIAVRPASPHASGLAVMGMSLAVAGAGILLAYLCYLKFPKLPEGLAEHYSGLYQVLVNKYYVDEFYNWLVVRPISRGSERILWRAVDVAAIDELMVNGSAELTAGAGSLLRRIQSGNLRSYAAWILLGAVLWLGYVLLR